MNKDEKRELRRKRLMENKAIRKYWLTKSLQSPLESLINRENFAAAQAAVEE